MIELENLCGKHHLSGAELLEVEEPDFSGCLETTSAVRFVLDGVVYQATEDPSDGYRSYLGSIKVVENVAVKYTFPPVEVLCYMHDDPDKNILVFRDLKSTKTILEVGTSYWDDYYPVCVFDWTPENMACNQEAANA